MHDLGPRRASRRPGYSLPELLVILALVAALLALAVQRISGASDRAAVQAASGELGSVLSRARQAAIDHREDVAVTLDSTTATVRVVGESGPVLTRRLGQSYGVQAHATRDSLAFDARGLGIGAANLSIVISRGRAVDTVYVSRLGRVRR